MPILPTRFLLRRGKRRVASIGTAPGTLTVDPAAVPAEISCCAYDEGRLLEKKVADVGELAQLRGQWPLLWVNVEGLGSLSVLEQIGSLFALHPLTLEDVVNVRQRPKVERYASYQFIVLRMLSQEPHLLPDQMSMVLGKDFVLTFQERKGDCFMPVRERLRRGEKRLRSGTSDYLAHALIDSLIDHYFPILENLGEGLDSLQSNILAAPGPAAVGQISQFKHDLSLLRRAVWPLRDELASLLRDGGFFGAQTAPYLRDCHDHTLTLIEMIETQREVVGSLMDIYLSSVNQRMNEVMKLLAVISTVFIPLTFISGVYGMNFNPDTSPYNMPELNAYWGYPTAILSMVVTASALVAFMWRKGWLQAQQ